ncbi:MAG TPA: hypothetical protein DEH78_31920 [Solibacterales bacterium]|nr:hypothetical protein [Bryobacterales bacterium]
MAVCLRTQGRFVSPGWVLGRKHHLGAYPGLTQRPGEQDRVDGEVYEVAPPLLAILDQYEGDEFAREELAVQTVGGDRLAWCYLYRGRRLP